MTPGEFRAMTERAHEAFARARDLVRRSAEAQAMAAELTVIANDLRWLARAECERARELAREPLRRHDTAIRQSSSTSASAAAVPTSAFYGLRSVRRRG